jgi:rhombotail lipoprotein
MKTSWLVLLSCMSLLLAGCEMWPNRSESRTSSSLVGFLYPDGSAPPSENSIPELKLPLRVGLAFLPSKNEAEGLEAARRDELLERIRKHFADRKFVAEIMLIPDYYLRGVRGFDGLEGVQRLYNTDVLALVSYDQVTYQDQNRWSLGYITIVGAYLVKGDRHDVTTLMDLAVVDPASRSILLRAGGVDTRHGTATNIDAQRETREARTEGFSGATDQLIDNFDVALTKFEADVKEGRANVRVVQRQAAGSGSGSGGGSADLFWLLLLVVVLLAKRLKQPETSVVASRSQIFNTSSERWSSTA